MHCVPGARYVRIGLGAIDEHIDGTRQPPLQSCRRRVRIWSDHQRPLVAEFDHAVADGAKQQLADRVPRFGRHADHRSIPACGGSGDESLGHIVRLDDVASPWQTAQVFGGEPFVVAGRLL